MPPPPASWPLQVDIAPPLTSKVVSESNVTCATSVPILVFLELSVFDLGPMYATDRRQKSDRQTSDAHHRLMPPIQGRGIIMYTTASCEDNRHLLHRSVHGVNQHLILLPCTAMFLSTDGNFACFFFSGMQAFISISENWSSCDGRMSRRLWTRRYYYRSAWVAITFSIGHRAT